MRVLVACEFSGVVRDAFLARGHDAISCDLEATESEGPHLQCDIREVDLQGFDLLIAHPPCTYLSVSGVRHLHSIPSRLGTLPAIHGAERWKLMHEAAEFFLWLLDAPVPHIAVENPVPHSYAELPHYSQIVQPWYFGDPYSKRTCLWLKNLPLLIPDNVAEPCYWNGKKMAYIPGTHWEGPGENRARERSRTYPGLARAMSEQWAEVAVEV